MSLITQATSLLAPFFIALSPILSYGDQIMAMHRNKTSAGFSLDIPLIMLIASFLRIFYWPNAKYDLSLLAQSILMVLVQLVLLKVALDHRPAPSTKGGEAGLPFAGANESSWSFQRPYNFWQWRSPKPFWQCILYFFIVLVVLELLLSPMPKLYATYSTAIGYIGLGVEATLPIPQILANARSKSCKGFRLSVLASWVGGDTMKLIWFFTSTSAIPWSFRISAMFQASCDFFLGAQYFWYGDGQAATTTVKEHPMTEWRPAPFNDAKEVE